MNDIEQYSHRKCAPLLGIKEKRNENPVDSIVNLAEEHLGMDGPSDVIDCAHRV